MSTNDDRLLDPAYVVDDITYQLWVDRYGNWTLVFGGVDQDGTLFTEEQAQRIQKYVCERLAPS